MNEFKRAREEYESTPIPEELDARVRAGIRQGRTSSRSRGYKVVRRTAGSVAACLAVLMAGLNVSPTFAAAAADVPVLGGLFQVLTIRDYETVENGIDYKVSVPGVESEGNLAEKVNAEIQERVDAHLAQAQADWDDYKDAFLATGGTEEEWADREMNVLIDYEIKSQTDTTVSFVVDFAEGWVAAMQQRYCYNLDLANDKDITLADVLGEDWVGICNDAVNAKIAADESGLFFTPEQGGFTTVDDATSFYLNEDGSVTLVFPEYSIAAGAAEQSEQSTGTSGALEEVREVAESTSKNMEMFTASLLTFQSGMEELDMIVNALVAGDFDQALSDKFVEWTPKLELHVPLVDREHKLLVEYINELHQAMTHNKPVSEMIGVLKKLRDYTATHFGDEEKLFNVPAYKAAAEHMKIHKKFVAKLDEVEEQLRMGTATVSMDLLTFLKDWLVQHIMGTDPTYLPYLKPEDKEPA